jgi:protein SCO1/2
MLLALVLASCATPTTAPGDSGADALGAVPEPLRKVRATYETPDVVLVDQTNTVHRLPDLLADDRPVVMNFVFTTCTTICPVMTATFSQVAEQMRSDTSDLLMISISLDPEYDTPEILQQYADRYGVGANWRLLTGRAHDVLAVLDAFDALSGSKMNHRPYAYARAAGATEWVRVEGLLPAAQLAHELDAALIAQ